MRAKYIALVASLCLLPVSCSPSDGVSQLAITAENAETVAGQSTGAMDFMGRMSDLAEAFVPVLSGNAQTIPCDQGNMIIAGEDTAPQGELNAGDWASITFQGCVFNLFGIPVTLNGTLGLTADEVTGGGEPGQPFSAAYTVTYSSATLQVFGVTWNVNGAFTMEASSADGVTVLTAVSGDYLSGFVSGGGQAFSGTLTNFRREFTLNTETNAYTFTLDADVSGSGGALNYNTTNSFAGVLGSDPDLGDIVVTGANGSSLTLRALDNVNVELLLDIDGDGSTDVTINTTWNEL